MSPALTTVRQPLAEMGRMAVSLLTRLIDNQSIEALHVELATRFVLRGSTQRLLPSSEGAASMIAWPPNDSNHCCAMRSRTRTSSASRIAPAAATTFR